MSAIDELIDLVERAGAAERAALASKWKDRDDVEALRTKVRRAIDEDRDEKRPAAAAAPLGDAAAVVAESDAVNAVGIARRALMDAHLAVLDARLARIDAGETEPETAAVDGHVPLPGRNAVARHGPALAHGLHGEIEYMLKRKPRSIIKSLAVGLALGLLYLGFLRVFEWDRDQKWLPYLGLFAISVVMGGAVCLNAMSFDAMRVRAALDSGARLWHLLVIKNLALLIIVAPIGFLLSGLLAWRAGDLAAFFKACALMVCFIVLWLAVGNVLSVVVPIRDEPIWRRRKSGTIKQFLIAFTVSYLIGYAVNLMLIWRVFAAQEFAQRWGGWGLPALLVVLSSLFMWFLLTVFAIALSQQPKIRRVLMREIADYNSNAEARALAAESKGSGDPADPRNRGNPGNPGNPGSSGSSGSSGDSADEPRPART